jgi:hypothetical protein
MVRNMSNTSYSRGIGRRTTVYSWPRQKMRGLTWKTAIEMGLGVQIKWESACLQSVRVLVQPQYHPQNNNLICIFPIKILILNKLWVMRQKNGHRRWVFL